MSSTLPSTPGRASILPLLVGLLILLWTAAAAAQEEDQDEDRTPWGYTLVAGVGFGTYSGGESASQSATLYISRPGQYWRFSLGHATLFSAEGYGMGIGHSRDLGSGFRLSAGVGTGLNRHGSIYPRYQVGASLSKVMLSSRRLVASLSYTRRQSKRSVYFSDRFGTGLTWYAPGPWVFGGHAAYSLGRPGDRVSLSGGLSVSYVLWKRRSVGLRIGYGDGSYMLWPSQRIVDFNVWSYAAGYTHYLSPDLSLRFGAGHDTYYDGANFSLTLAKSW